MVKAKKSLGQNFLHDEAILIKTIEFAELQASDHVLEIGPGKGALTERILQKVSKLTAIELDDRLIPILQEKYGHYKNFELVHQDALQYQPPQSPYKIVANIPYYISSPLLNHYLLEQFINGNPPEMIIFMIQKEVAEKIIAKDGKHSVLSLQVHLFGEPSLICVVPKTAFDPVPKVDSALIKIRVFKEPKINLDLKKLFWLFKVSFAQKRKMLSKNLSSILRIDANEIKTRLSKIGIDPSARAEVLTLEDWEKLYFEFIESA